MLCGREAPFNRVHLRNMTLAAEGGATIFPGIPAFYFHPASTEDIAREFVNRVLAHIGLPQVGAYQWKGEGTPSHPTPKDGVRIGHPRNSGHKHLAFSTR